MTHKGIDIADGKLVTFTAKDKLLLNGFLIEGKKRRTCIIYVHGMTGNFYSSKLSKEIAIEGRKNDISTFMINTRGHDIESNGKLASSRKSKRFTVGTRVERFEDSVYDIGGAIKALKTLGYRKFILAGHSTGCQKILYYQYRKRDGSVIGLAHLAPDDDYNLEKSKAKGRWKNMVKRAKTLVKQGHGNGYDPELPFAPLRFLSIADLRNVESRLFNYDGKMSEFSNVRTPTYIAFGTKDEGAVKPVREYIKILADKTGSGKFKYLIIKGAYHSFRGHEGEIAKSVVSWSRSL